MNNWFNTLNDALSAEGIINTWDISYSPIGYGETYSYTYNDGTKYGHFVSIYRDENGRYERPIHYARG
jgi:hypothetical protein